MTDKLQLAEQLLAVLKNDFPQITTITLERPRDFAYGDYASPVALKFSRVFKKNPAQLAEQIAEIWRQHCTQWLEKIEVAAPGFINLTLKKGIAQKVISRILSLEQSEIQYGFNTIEANAPSLILEFVSANPTGPLHVGHGRQGVLGDVLARLFESQGWRVHREFYYNDAGVQIQNLALSVAARISGLSPDDPAFPEGGYRGQYIVDIAEKYKSIYSAELFADLDQIRLFAVTYLRGEQNRDLEALGVKFDQFYLESSLYSDGRVQSTVDELKKSGKTFEDGGALWLRTTEFGDDKDRVMQKSDGSFTYFVPDVAYHQVKWQRGFTRAINVQGIDHHGTITRVRAGLQALRENIPSSYPEYVLHKMVTVMKNGEEIKISKRAGTYVTLRDLIEWSGDSQTELSLESKTQKGRDAVRFFLVMRKADTEFVFDIDLALAQGDDNPVYYVQYAHARICALLKNWAVISGLNPSAARAQLIQNRLQFESYFVELTNPHEMMLLRSLEDFPELLTRATTELSPHLIVFYLRELASQLHSYYNDTRILTTVAGLKEARLLLVCAVQDVLKNGLSILGVSSPDSM